MTTSARSTGKLSTGSSEFQFRIRPSPGIRVSQAGAPFALKIGGRTPGLQVELKSHGWQFPKGEPELEAAGADEIVIRWKTPPAEVSEIFTAQDGCLERRIKVVNTSRRLLQLTGVRLHLPDLSLGAPRDCRVEAPASGLRPRLPQMRRSSRIAWLTTGASAWLPARRSCGGRGSGMRRM